MSSLSCGANAFDEWKVTHATGYPDPVEFQSEALARAFQARHGGTIWHRLASQWERCGVRSESEVSHV